MNFSELLLAILSFICFLVIVLFLVVLGKYLALKRSIISLLHARKPYKRVKMLNLVICSMLQVGTVSGFYSYRVSVLFAS